jgi:Peptidase M15
MKKACTHHTVTTAKLWRALRTATLFAGATLASVLMVNLPAQSAAHAHGQGDTSVALVPTSGEWISLGIGAGETRVPVPASAIDELEPAQPARSRQVPTMQLASLGRNQLGQERLGRSLSGGQVRWSASAGCLNASLRSVIAAVSANFGPVIVNSTCRSRRRNAGVGGARRSRHLTGDAADFKVGSNARAVLAFRRPPWRRRFEALCRRTLSHRHRTSPNLVI